MAANSDDIKRADRTKRLLVAQEKKIDASIEPEKRKAMAAKMLDELLHDDSWREMLNPEGIEFDDLGDDLMCHMEAQASEDGEWMDDLPRKKVKIRVEER